MKRPWFTWVIFGGCMGIVLLAMGWMTQTTLELDRARAAARRQAVIEESVRLALWRMDSGLASLVASESARPYFDYSAFYPAERAYTRMFAPVGPGEILIPSPLLTLSPVHIHLHFQLNPDGTFSSPRVPIGNMRDLAEGRFTSPEQIEDDATRLAQLAQVVTRAALAGLPANMDLDPIELAELPAPRVSAELAFKDQSAQEQRNEAEYQMRSRVSKQAIFSNLRPGAYDNAGSEPLQSSRESMALVEETPALAPAAAEPLERRIVEGLMTPIWVEDLLLLARRVTINGDEYIQGCWLDWTSLKEWLLPGVWDLLPEADLEPLRTAATRGGERLLATLPARFIPGPPPVLPEQRISPMRLSLMIAWGCALLAGLAAAFLLQGTLSLGERRAAFVSAVTHELRTPLTTFRMYAEMLAGGMVATEEKRAEYLATLTKEAERLSHLVENVLAYARLEKDRSGERSETVIVQDLIERVAERLQERVVQAGRSLTVKLSLEAQTTVVMTDVSAVEQILFNLIDNACKYAHPADDLRIHLEVSRERRSVHIGIRDHGPGIAPREARRLFRPFSKSARDAANSAPGVGLGLALSKRLARKMKGDLKVDTNHDGGARFVLKLPRAARPHPHSIRAQTAG